MSANLRSSKIKKSCCSLSAVSLWTRSWSKSSTMSMCVCTSAGGRADRSGQIIHTQSRSFFSATAHLDEADIRGNALDDAQEVFLFGDVDTDTQIRLLPLHCLEERLGRGVCKGRNAVCVRLCCYACGHGGEGSGKNGGGEGIKSGALDGGRRQ